MKTVFEVEVIEVRPNGISVKLLAWNQIGFIRRRELSWDRRVGFTPPIPKVGEKLKAVLLKDKPNLQLSLRNIINPWQDVAQKFREGQVVRAEVVNVRHFAAFVQIQPGIDAIIRPREIPLAHNQLATDVLSIGDQVQGVITNLDLEQHKIEISLIQHLHALDSAYARRKSIQLALFTDNLHPTTKPSMSTPTTLDHPRRRYHPPILPPKRLLVVDDGKNCLEEICHHLASNFNLEVDGVESGEEGLNKVQEGVEYDIAVIDVSLKGERGAKVGKQLLHLKAELALIFTSSNPFVENEEITIEGRLYPFAFKEPEEIADWVEKLCHGYWETPARAKELDDSQATFIRQLGMSALARRSLPDVLQEMLANLRQETNVSQAVVVEVDSIKKQVTILAADPILAQEIQQYSLDGLYYSPVREVVEEEREFYETYIQPDRSLRFKHFFPLLAFQTTFGIPLKIPDLPTRHALFLFDEQKPKLKPESRHQARVASAVMQVALERALLLDYMRRYEQRYTQGQLLGSLAHELRTKLDGLAAYGLTLSAILQKADNSTDSKNKAKLTKKSIELAHQITRAKDELAELVHAYSRLARDDFEAVDVNQVIRQVKRQLDYKAREANVKIELDQRATLPLARAIESRLMQILLNLMLNAIQQIEAQAKRMKQIAPAQNKAALLQSGLVIVQTNYNKKASYPIQINIFDTGPGIHYEQQESIFLLDSSTRQKGQGLGLYISRNLAETMGGRLRLVDSLMFIGSAFTIELPLYDIIKK